MNPLFPSLIGLDVNPHGIHFVQLKKRYGRYDLEKMAKQPLSPAIFSEGKIKNWDKLKVALSELLDTLQIREINAAIHLPSALVRMQSISVPKGLGEADIEAEIRAQVHRDFPGMTEVLCMDYRITNQANEAELFFAVARQEYVMQYARTIEQVGLKVKIVDIEVYALHRAICFAHPFLHDKTHAILYCQTEAVALFIFNGDNIIFSQHWEVQDTLSLIAQIQQNLQIYATHFPQQTLDQFSFCGTPDLVIKLKEALAAHIDCQIILPDPFALMTRRIPLPACAASFLVACGLALQEVPRW